MKKEDLQVENGNYTRIANAILDSLVSAQISGSELRIVLAVIRKTYGYHKTEDSISLSQLQKITNISKRNVVYLLQNLEAKKILIISRSHYQCNIIRFNKYSDTWVVQSYAEQTKKNRNRAKEYSAKLRNRVVQSYEGSAKLGNEVVQNSVKTGKSFAHTKDNTTKDNTKEMGTPPNDNKDFFNKGVKYTELLEIYSKERDRNIIEKEFDKFILYWTESNASGTKQRWQMQPVFDVKRRLLTWLSKINNFTNNKPRVVLS